MSHETTRRNAQLQKRASDESWRESCSLSYSFEHVNRTPATPAKSVSFRACLAPFFLRSHLTFRPFLASLYLAKEDCKLLALTATTNLLLLGLATLSLVSAGDAAVRCAEDQNKQRALSLSYRSCRCHSLPPSRQTASRRATQQQCVLSP